MSMNYGQSRPTTSGGAPATNGVGCFLFLVFFVVGAVSPPCFSGSCPGQPNFNNILPVLLPVIVAILLGWLLYFSMRIARQWESAIVLRLGRYSRTAGPGIFLHDPLD